MKPRNFRYSSFLPALAVISLSAPAVFAATGTWVGNTNYWYQTAGSDWAGVSGDAWNGTSGPNNVAIIPTGNFGGVGSSTTVYANGIIFQSSRSLATGDAINLAGTNPFINVTSGQNVQMFTNLTGTLGFTKTGAGTLDLNGGGGVRGITGGITVSQGGLRLTLGGSPNVVNSSNTLSLSGSNLEVFGNGTQTLSNFTLGNGGSRIVLTPNGASNSTTLSLANWTRASNSSVLIDLSATGTAKTLTLTGTLPTLTNSLIGGYATIKDSTGYGFATLSGNDVVRYTGATPVNVNLGANTVSTTNYKSTGAGNYFNGPATTQYLNSLEHSVSGTVGGTVAATFVVGSGGVMMSSTGANNKIDLNLTSATSELQISTAGYNSGWEKQELRGVKDNGGTSVSLVKAGPGALNMGTGTFTYTGDTIVNQGYLVDITNIPSGTGKGNLVVNSPSTANSGIVNIGVPAAGGTRTINGLSNTTLAGGTVTNINIGGTAAGAANVCFLNLGNGDATASFAGIVTGPLSIVKSGTGTQTFSGVSTYAGSTAVNAGKLTIASTGTINGTSAITIGAGDFNYNSATALSQGVSFNSTGGTLSGTGTITPSVTISAGNTLAPGNSIGTLTFGTNLTLAGTYSVELGTVNANPALSLSDRTVVTGTLALGGNLTLVNNAGANGNGSAAAGAYRIATSTGATSGNFASITNPLSATLHEKVVYGTNTTDLNLYRLATGSTSAVSLGKARVGDTFTGSLTTTNTATADGFSEKLNASVGSNAGDVTSSSGSVSGVIAGANASTISVGLSTATAGAKSGSVQVSYVSDGTGLNNYTTTANGSQTVGVTGAVYDLASVNLTNTGGAGSFSGTTPTFTLNFGTGLALSTNYTATFSLANGLFSLYKDNLTGDYGTLTGPFSTTASDFANLVSGGADTFSITFNSGVGGTFSDTFTFGGTSVQSGLTDASAGGFSIALSATAVPEPNVAALLGGLGMLALLRRRRTA